VAITYRRNNVFGRTLLVWLLIILLETVLGTMRTLFVEPQLGALKSRQLAIIPSLIMIFIVTWFCLPWIGAPDLRQLVAVGVVWVTLTLGFEIVLGRLVLRRDWKQLLADYDVLNGGYMAVALLLMGAMPLVVAKLR
jgi:hypothetical protein